MYARVRVQVVGVEEERREEKRREERRAKGRDGCEDAKTKM
jgi:hypothetical protein